MLKCKLKRNDTESNDMLLLLLAMMDYRNQIYPSILNNLKSEQNIYCFLIMDNIKLSTVISERREINKVSIMIVPRLLPGKSREK